jgi:formiminoglutamase
MSEFKPADPRLFFSKNDPDDPRLGDLVHKGQEGAKLAIIGYPDDEGIRLNGGRVGAAEGPTEIRRWLYRMTPNANRDIKAFCDLGDLPPQGPLEKRHEQARAFVASRLKEGLQVLSLGGGNDYAFPDGDGFLSVFAGQKPVVINIDAHFDVREMNLGPSSGTPFFRLLESKHEFDFFEIGIQAQCNSTKHWKYVEGKGGKILTLEEILESGKPMIETANQILGEQWLRRRPAFLAIDIDAFAWPYAIGSSASWPIGLDPSTFWPLFQCLLKRLDVRVLGIYEVSPPLDVSHGTAKLAAQFAHGFLHV